MSRKGKVLVAIMNNRHDFTAARDDHWYRIPISSAAKWLKNRWPPQWIAFYQTKIFGEEAFSVNYYARVLNVHQVYRYQLFPNEARDEKGLRQYHRLDLGPLQRRPQPIISRRLRRIVFIPTTWRKFIAATEINDLYDDSPLEDQLWLELKHLGIPAERQEFVKVKKRSYALDFAVYCAAGNLDVETDGDTWHANPERIPLDNIRDNDLETAGWKLLRFNTHHIHEQMAEYCVPTIVENVNLLGGIDVGGELPQQFNLDEPGQARQLGLFDKLGQSGDN